MKSLPQQKTNSLVHEIHAILLVYLRQTRLANQADMKIHVENKKRDKKCRLLSQRVEKLRVSCQISFCQHCEEDIADFAHKKIKG